MKRAKRGQVKVTCARWLSVFLALMLILGTHVTGIAAEVSDGTGTDAVVTEAVWAEDDVPAAAEIPSVPEENTEVPLETTEPDASAPAEPEEEPEAETEAPEEAEDEVPEEPAAEDVRYSASVNEIKVTATAKADAFDEEVRLVVAVLEADSEEYKDAEKALSEDGQKFDGMMAFDISFESTATGKKVEPKDGSIVAVNMTVNKTALSELDATEIDTDSMQVSHITGNSVETVADVADKTDGQVTVVTDDAEVKSVKAEFEVEGFSTFTLTWTNGENEEGATIYWGYMDGDTFVELEEGSTVTLDTTASTVSLKNSFEGYQYLDAVYCTSGQSLAEGVDIKATLYKTSTGWACDAITTGESEEPVVTRTDIADKSEIYVTYFQPESAPPSGADDSNVPSPTTTKTVTHNSDGTYTIRLEIEGATVTEDNSHYANVLVILDATRSMNGAKWTNAKAAMNTLIETLVEGDNSDNAGKIDFALVTFGRSATVVQNWTKNNTTFKSTCAGINMVTTSGTNWEAGMRGGLYGVLNNMPDDDPTYVIFLTDGDPNVYYSSGSATNYTNTGTTAGYSQNNNTSANRAADEARAIAAATKLYGIYCGDSGTNPSGESFNRLVNVITGNGQGGQKAIAANADTIENEFKLIAQTMLDEMGASGVAVDDGIPSLSSVSSNVAGEASGYTYYIKPAGATEFTEWADAPGATYSNDNGVTWDLSVVGTLPAGASYAIEFTVWPSQEAYDTIADLNNGVITMSQAELDAAGIDKKENPDGSYTYYLLTNTHLNTTYEFKGQKYSDKPDEVPTEEMILPTETIGVQKIWNNYLDQQNPPPGVALVLQKDGQDYLYGDNAVEVSSATGWKKDDIYISLGQIRKTANDYEVLETGHDYEIVEPENYEGDYRWELTSEVYHPMVINGTTTMLILDDEATGTDGTDYYLLGGHKYKVAPGGGNMLKAWNDRRSWLQIEKKVTGTGAPADALFEFTIEIEEAKQEDVWFSAFGPDGIIKDLETNATAEDGNTGYFYAASGASITVKLQVGWTLRFLNLNSGTTYTIDETGFPDGFAFVSAEGRTQVDTDAEQDDPETPSADGSTVTGTINVPNVEFYVDYTNKYEETEAEFTKAWEDADDQDGIRLTAAEFKDNISLLVNGTVSTDYDENLTITDNGDNTYTIKYTELPKYIDNTEVEYKLQETTVPDDYTVSPENAIVDNGGTITNSHTPKTTNISVTKLWVGDENYTSLRPESVTVVLLADGEDAGEDPLVLTADTSWSGSWEDLPVNKAGTEIEYTLDELEVENYTTTGVQLTKGDDGNYTAEITNTLTLEDLTVEKIVKGLFGDKEKKFSITVEALVGETSVISKTFSLAHGESDVLEDVPVGAMIKVSESDAGDYRKEFKFTPNDGTASSVTESTAFKFTGPGTITVTNTNNTIPDTGINLDTLPYVLILAAVAVIAVLVIVRRRRNHYDE